jgi:penicillin amidase
MRILRVLPLILTVVVLWALNHSFSASIPAFGKIIDPVNGVMAAAEPFDEDFNRNLHLKDLQSQVEVWMDTAMIPHIRAGNDHDLYYTQGYIHAYFRLWQMDMQTRAAWGRISEVAGAKAIDFDRGMRREGMVWGAQHSLEAMEKEPRTKAMLDAYRDGINAYIHSLNYRALPLEYKLMGFAPEDWTNLRTALLMKYMARDLTGKTDDIAYTILRDQIGQQEFDFLFPERIKGSKPVIPEGTKWESASMEVPSAPGDSVWAHFKESTTASNENGKCSPNLCHSRRESHRLSGIEEYEIPCGNDKFAASSPQLVSREAEPESGIGSNNWAISGTHTASGKAILCNDPHLGLNLPSLWFEMQLSAPGINCYGASLPGAPGIVIGFNDKISWGFTNNYRDVKDFYEITPVQLPKSFTGAGNRSIGELGKVGYRAYHFGRHYQVLPFDRSIEVIKVRGAADVVDTVLYTIHGPVTFDPTFRITSTDASPPLSSGASLLACTWMAHRGSNELMATYLLNRAGDYNAFTEAISHFECPAQNIAYADASNNIAMWGQGRFINKWKGQGKYVMRGDDSSTLWGQDIPMSENPHVLNPPQGYVASANQQVTDSTYPYWYNGSFTEWRSWEINDFICFDCPSHAYADRPGFVVSLATIDTEDSHFFSMMRLQNRTRSLLNSEISATSIPVGPISMRKLFVPNDRVLSYLSEADKEEWHPDWLDPTDRSGTIVQVFWSRLYKDIWQDDFPAIAKWPSSEVTFQLLLSDSTSKYYDDKRTQQVETLRDIVQRAFKETTDSLDRLRASASPRFKDEALQWYNVKNTSLTHLAKIPAFSYDHLKIGGWSNTINACTGTHGPSWRMIVEMDSIPRAYTIYPGGQSGNPGSPYYSDFIQQWVEGKYHAAQFITASTTKNPLKYTWIMKGA